MKYLTKFTIIHYLPLRLYTNLAEISMNRVTIDVYLNSCKNIATVSIRVRTNTDKRLLRSAPWCW